MKLLHKLFISYLAVVITGLVVLALSTAFVAPVTFTQQMNHMGGNINSMMGQHRQELTDEIESSFRNSLTNALAIAGIAATLAAGIVSWFVSYRIVRPINALVALSQRIANGHYEQRLHLATGDELSELVDNFNRMAASLAETEVMRQRLLGDVTHELKTPLTSIKGYMEGLQDGVLPATPETFQLIHHEADRLQRLVQDLQELSRVEAGQIPLEIVACSAGQIALPVLERMRPQFREKGITLKSTIPDDLPPIRADVDRTAQVLTNLLGNALQYTSRGGTVTLTVLKRDNQLCFSIHDSGIGLEASDLERIFQRFYRVDKSRSRTSGGSGIGLTIAKQLVEAQGGTILAESAGLSKGSQFSFTLPLA
ncbi:MAG: HAMP domain-containing protein [Chloroflexi bacterium]|nr:HAMP domain-containing protein [Chloroflexota bacterium]